MYNYGLGANDWTDIFPDESAGGTTEEPPMEMPDDSPPAVVPTTGVLDRIKTPLGLGAIGALAGFLFARSKKKRIRAALLGGAAGYGASFFVK